MSKFLNPTRVVTSKDAIYPDALINNRDIQPLFFSYKGEEAIEGFTTIKKGGYVLVDFGKELRGGINITVQWAADESKCKLHIVFGESVMEALSNIGEKNAGNYHSVRDYTISCPNMSTQRIGDTGFRFARIEAIDSNVIINTVKAVSDVREMEHKGTFECNDALLNKIWEVGAYTVQLNTDEYIWDGLKRDRLVWIGDMHPETSTISAVFGKDNSIPKSLDYVNKNTPNGEWMNNIPTYSMWWVMIHHDYYMHWGDLDYLKAQEKSLTALIDKSIALIDSNFASDDDLYEFVDWSSRYTDAAFEGRLAVFCLGFNRAAILCDALGNTAYADKCRKYASKLKTMTVECTLSKPMAALSVLSDRNSHNAIELLMGNSAEDMSCFMGYYILLAKAKMGQYTEALDMTRAYWGAMLKMGATTFWEDFDIKWLENSAGIEEVTPEGMNDIHGDFGKHCYLQFRHSLCHGWSSGPTPFLMEQIGGIEILEPGCKKVKISPNMGDLEWIKVTYPTPYGSIKISATQKDGAISTEIDAPAEIEIVR